MAQVYPGIPMVDLPNMRPELLEDAAPVPRDLWVALYESHRCARELMRVLYRAWGSSRGRLPDVRPDLVGLAEELGVEIMLATRRTPAFISRDHERQHSEGRPVPGNPSRRDFQDAGAVFKAIAKLMHETSAEGLAEWVNPALPAVDLSTMRAQLATALLSCEEPMRAYASVVRRMKAMEKLGRRSSAW